MSSAQISKAAWLIAAAALLVFGLIAQFGSQVSGLSLFSSDDTPNIVTANDSSAVELGMKFRSSVATQVTGLKFYKSPQNTGIHVGNLWSTSGSKLAKVTFSNESASGWQTATFSTPVSIAANTTYIVSYHAPNGYYSVDENYFNESHTNGTLTALADGAQGGNGVYKYGSGGFPTDTWRASNYWVDIITASSDSTPPTVSISAPTSGSTVSGNAVVTASADDNVSVSKVQFKLDGANLGAADTTAPYSVPWNSKSATNDQHTLTAVATDSSGNSTTSSSINVTVDNQAAPPSDVSLWEDTVTPAILADSDSAAVELGVKFRSSEATSVKAIQFYKSTTNTGTHVGNLWSANGTKLASVTFSNETPSGWQTAQLSTPVDIQANTTYVVSYHTTTGHYSANANYFSSSHTNGILAALANGSAGGNGVYKYGASGFPNNTWNASNYWVDVVVGSSVPSDTVNPTVDSVAPNDGATDVATGVTPSATFSESLDPATVNTSSVALQNATGQEVTSSVSYDDSAKTITISPSAALEQGVAYSVSLSTGIKDTSGNPLASVYSWTFTTTQPTSGEPIDPLAEGNGGPILVVVKSGQAIGNYYAEILRAEGLNSFTTVEVGTLNSILLADYDVVLLADMALTDGQVTTLNTWVNAGGNLIAMSPDKKLASLLGLTDQSSILSDAYLQVDGSAAPGAGIVGETIQYHGDADLYSANSDTSTVATLYSSASTATASPAVTKRTVGTNGGHAVAFTYDLATSIVRSHQGNASWNNTNRDSYATIRPNDLFYGDAAGDSQPDYVNLEKVAIPQADEQQRLLTNIILDVNRDSKPLAKFGYFPYNKKAVLVMVGDDHGGSGAGTIFDAQLAASPAGCSVADWECVRSTALMYTNSALTAAKAQSYSDQGFEIGLHVNPSNETGVPSDPGCGYWSAGAVSWLGDQFDSELAQWRNLYPNLPNQMTTRNHCAAWTDYDTSAKVQAARGLRVDLNYYYWPGSWIQNRPGFFTGSGIPMRYTDIDGNFIDTYQVPSHLVNESDIAWPAGIATQLDRALGPEGYYGAFGTHYDYRGDGFENMLLQQAQQRDVPLVSGKQIGNWTDARNNSYFADQMWNGSVYSFEAIVDSGARSMMRALVPFNSTDGSISSISKDGATVEFSTENMKGIRYAVFTVTSGNYTVTYTADTSAPTVSAIVPANNATEVVTGASIEITMSEPVDATSLSSSSVTLLNGSSEVPSVVSYNANESKITIDPNSVLSANTIYTVQLSTAIKDVAGNNLASEFTSTFTTSDATVSIWAPAPQTVSTATSDTADVELGVRLSSTTAGEIRSVLFYKSTADGQANHTITLWDANGTSLGAATTASETATGWQTATFDTPIAIQPNTVYTASYRAPAGKYSFTTAGLTSAVTNGPLSVPVGGGVFVYGGGYPSNSFNNTNYWVDVVFSAQ